VDQARETGADFIFAGPHGVTGITRFLLGSVARAIVRFAPCSVELVRTHSPHAAPPQAMKILLATDGSDYSQVAARSIAARPWPSGTEVRILSVGELGFFALQAANTATLQPDPWPGVLEPPLDSPAAMEMLREGARKHAQSAARAAEKIVSESGLKTSQTISVDDPTPAILEEARRWNADMIVVGCHGRRGVNRFLLGSVSEKVAMHAECSVEVIRPV